MPFTPFHFGPGALCKAGGGRHFSFLTSAGSQVLIDIEPLVRILRGDAVLHGPTHSLLGATALGLLAAAIGRMAAPWLLRMHGTDVAAIGWQVALISGLIGTWSHVGLDAIMHADMNPLWPFVQGNALLGLIPLDILHWLCVAAGVLGAAVIGWRLQRSG